MFGTFSFNSRASLEAFIIKENVSGKSFPAFVCAHSIFSHDVESSSVSEDQKLLARQGISAPTTRRYITLFQERYNRPYTGEKKTIDAGTKISALSSILKWRGESGQDGESQKIKSTLRTASATAKTYADNNLPLGQARELAKELISVSVDFHEKLHSHFEDEVTKLTQMGIPGDDALLLVSEQYTLIFDRMFDVRKLMTEYSTDVDEVSYLVDSLWITLKTHMVMAAFVENGLKYNTTISASFIRFLTRQTGSNVSAGVGGLLKNYQKGFAC